MPQQTKNCLQHQPNQAATIPNDGYMRVWHIVGDKKRGIQGVLPISRSSFLAGVKSGRYQVNPVKLGDRSTGYKVEEIRALLARFGGGQ